MPLEALPASSHLSSYKNHNKVRTCEVGTTVHATWLLRLLFTTGYYGYRILE
jgi:hypothetical protein